MMLSSYGKLALPPNALSFALDSLCQLESALTLPEPSF